MQTENEQIEQQIEQKKQKTQYFKYNFYGQRTVITSRQFIFKLPTLDITIISFFILWNLFYLYCFYGSYFAGMTDFTIFFSIFSLMIIFVCIYFRLKAEHELKDVDSQAYKIYYFSRLSFISMALVGCCGYAAVIYFIANFDSLVSLRVEIKDKLLKDIQNLPVSIYWIQIINICYTLYVCYFISHQIFWHRLLDMSWCDNNIGDILQDAAIQKKEMNEKEEEQVYQQRQNLLKNQEEDNDEQSKQEGQDDQKKEVDSIIDEVIEDE